MACCYRGAPVRTAFGRPMSTRTTDTPGLAWVFLLLMVGGLLLVYTVAQVILADSARPSLTGRLLGSSTPERVRMGYVPPVEAATAPSESATTTTADVAALAVPATEAVAPPTAAPTAVPANRQADRFRVANTDGVGVVLHTAPSRDARVPRGLMEGTAVTVVERVGTDWARVRADNGQEGWIGSAYLAPAE